MEQRNAPETAEASADRVTVGAESVLASAGSVVASADTVVSSADTIVQAVRLIKWLMVVLIVLSVGGFIRSFQVQDSADKAAAASNDAEHASNEAVAASHTAEGISEESRDAALDSLEELRAAIQRSQNDPQAAHALQAIFRIEAALCGGPCPEVESP